MNPVLIDTSVWIVTLRKDAKKDLVRDVQRLILNGSAATCGMIMLELLGGTRSAREYGKLQEELQALQYASETAEIWQGSWRLASEMRRKGLTVPSTDILIASVAMGHGCVLMHADRHFELIAEHTDLVTHPVFVK